MENNKSTISGRELSQGEGIAFEMIRPSIRELIVKDYATFSAGKFIAIDELDQYREKYIASFLSARNSELSDLDHQVMDSLIDNSILSDKINSEELGVQNFGQRIADKVATFGGSWTFIISFACFLLVWIAANVIWLSNKGFDPYPFILLNLILSCIAAMQAPVIMMSQNRQEEKDRDRAKKDYMINLKSEIEIRMLHEKIDHSILHQQQALLEIQKLQVEMMNDILERIRLNQK